MFISFHHRPNVMNDVASMSGRLRRRGGLICANRRGGEIRGNGASAFRVEEVTD